MEVAARAAVMASGAAGAGWEGKGFFGAGLVLKIFKNILPGFECSRDCLGCLLTLLDAVVKSSIWSLYIRSFLTTPFKFTVVKWADEIFSILDLSLAEAILSVVLFKSLSTIFKALSIYKGLS